MPLAFEIADHPTVMRHAAALNRDRGRLTTPPLPHHRAYGSVPRRFGGLKRPPAYPLENSPRPLKRLVGESAMQRA